MDRVRMGVLGCADIAWRRMLPALTAHPSVEVVAVGSRDPAKAAAFTGRFGGEPVTGYEAVLDRSDVDAVYVPLPPSLTADWTRRALRQDKHVLSEKPLTGSAREAAGLRDLARARGRVLFENYMFLCHPQHRLVDDLLAAGRIGRLRSLTAEFTIPGKPADDIRHRPDLDGGALTGIGGYPLRTALRYLGPGLDVVGALLRPDPHTGVDTDGAALLTAADGTPAQVAFGLRHAYRGRYELTGSEGHITVPRAYTPPADHPAVIHLERDGVREELTVPPHDQFRSVVTDFVEGIRSGAPARSTLAGEALVEQARLVEAVRAAARRGR
ncbi:Gfo/Idh/MocA family protein [Streptomyces longispororuber]|uniref:Gfo/Idh/MocA family protein n=1 Tax=Streptomyces longispororuber TaxID=68230 RepID=UPI002108C74F|nr:Gfo/Idh/MocA family oxidoreductase [Streptomyces longispororuber]MCQ4212352.1 Gfo/Idh/MocA family oxidoreductase [Streptomyces longispororuber]